MANFPLAEDSGGGSVGIMLTKQELLDLQFIQSRHQLIELAAFLDRIDRHPGPCDFRHEALVKALPILSSDRADRARAVLEALSDMSLDPLPAAPFQGATGAPNPITAA